MVIAKAITSPNPEKTEIKALRQVSLNYSDEMVSIANKDAEINGMIGLTFVLGHSNEKILSVSNTKW